MESIKVFEMLQAGGDVATIAVAFIMFKFHTRLTRVETKLEMLK